MNKENNRSAAGLRRSAIAERIKLREEWSALKGNYCKDNAPERVLTKKKTNLTAAGAANNVPGLSSRKPSSRNMARTDDVLCGVVALVDVGCEAKALPLRAALAALGATVLPAWSPLVTHLVWAQGGCRSTRARARALACRLVSPLWVEACAAGARRLPEQSFPPAPRPSDLPSPRTLRRLLVKADMENIPIMNMLSDSNDENQKMFRLRISSETEHDTDTSRDVSKGTSRDTSKDTTNDTSRDTSTDVESRVNTAPRRPIPTPAIAAPPAKSRRKLFHQKEGDVTRHSESEEEQTQTKKRIPKPSYKPATKKKVELTVQKQVIDKKELARAERLARKLVNGCKQITTTTVRSDTTPRIVLTGMSRSERRAVTEAIKALNGAVQAAVDRRTTHVLLGSFLPDEDYNKTLMTGIAPLSPSHFVPAKPRTVSALEGAARGCRVLRAQWALDSQLAGRWLHHNGYEVPHLRKISQNALVERSALGKLHSEYAYDVFCGMRVRVGRQAANRDGAIRLLRLCGAIVQDEADNNGLKKHPQIPDGPSQYFVTQHPDVEFDVKVGSDVNDIDSRWVFDSVASGRMRTTRRYVIKTSETEDELFAQLQSLGC